MALRALWTGKTHMAQLGLLGTHRQVHHGSDTAHVQHNAPEIIRRNHGQKRSYHSGLARREPKIILRITQAITSDSPGLDNISDQNQSR